LRHRFLALGTVSILALLAVGCGGGGSSSTSSTASSLAVTPTGKVLPFTAVQAMKPGTKFFLILDRPGGKVSTAIKLSGTSDDANGRQIIFTISNQPVGTGDSGSLIVDQHGSSVGALSSGFGATDNIFTATAIEDEESILLSGPTVKKMKPATASVPNDGLRRIVRGVSPYIWGIVSKDSRNPISKAFSVDNTPPVKPRKDQPLATATAYSRTIFMVSSYGDAVSAYTTGSITTPYLSKLLCYGHYLSWEGGGQNIPCYYGTVTNFVVDPTEGSFKLGFPDMTQSAGTLVDDRRFGVVVDPTVTATPIPITGTVTLNTNAPVTFHGYVAQDADYADGFVLTNISQGVSNIIDASDIAGSATGSATINFTDGTSQTLDLTDAGSSAVVSDLYFLIEENIINEDTDAPIPIASLTFNYVITTS
jgi:hypothetical protein